MHFDTVFYDDNGNEDRQGLNFRSNSFCEVGKASLIIKRLFFRLNASRGYVTYKVYAGINGVSAPLWASAALDSRKSDDYIEFVDTRIRQVTVEGRRSAPDTAVVVGWLPLAH